LNSNLIGLSSIIYHNPSSTKTLVLYWVYVDPILLPNGLISVRRFEMTTDRYWRRQAGLLMAIGEMNWILHLANIIQLKNDPIIKTLIQYRACVDCLNSKYLPNVAK